MVFKRSDDANLPDGLYLKPYIDYDDWGRPWKIDIWLLDGAIIAVQRAESDRLKAGLTPALWEAIIRYKCSLLTREGRTPMYSGYWIYKAFLDEGLRDWGEITRYLIAHGIQVD